MFGGVVEPFFRSAASLSSICSRGAVTIGAAYEGLAEVGSSTPVRTAGGLGLCGSAPDLSESRSSLSSIYSNEPKCHRRRHGLRGYLGNAGGFVFNAVMAVGATMVFKPSRRPRRDRPWSRVRSSVDSAAATEHRPVY